MGGWRVREWIRSLGCTFLRGLTVTDWRRLLEENDGQIDPAYRGRAAATAAISQVNSAFHVRETAAFEERVRQVEIPPPLFVIGHFRSGTSHLHHLLASDPRFAFPNIYQSHFPQTFLTTEVLLSGVLSRLLPASVRQVDAVVETLASPAEDEWATCNMGAPSLNLSFVFPRRADHYDRFLSFRGASPAEVGRWQAALQFFAQKLTWKYGRPLVFKSPVHTARIRLLLEMFPAARFVHIHRHPFAVYNSMRHTSAFLERRGCLQEPLSEDESQQRIIDRYQTMYRAFHEEKSLIPAGRFHELSYDDLTRDPVGELAACYERLGLPAFSAVEGQLRQRFAGQRPFLPNRFGDIPRSIQRTLRRRWKSSFEAWDYSEVEPAKRCAARSGSVGSVQFSVFSVQCSVFSVQGGGLNTEN